MSGHKGCCSTALIPNQIDHPWMAVDSPIFPYTADQLAAITGYVLNNGSSTGPVTVNFLRGGMLAPPLPFNLIVKPGEYKSFTVVGVDTIKITPSSSVATGELNININFNPF